MYFRLSKSHQEWYRNWPAESISRHESLEELLFTLMCPIEKTTLWMVWQKQWLSWHYTGLGIGSITVAFHSCSLLPYPGQTWPEVFRNWPTESSERLRCKRLPVTVTFRRDTRNEKARVMCTKGFPRQLRTVRKPVGFSNRLQLPSLLSCSTCRGPQRNLPGCLVRSPRQHIWHYSLQLPCPMWPKTHHKNECKSDFHNECSEH